MIIKEVIVAMNQLAGCYGFVSLFVHVYVYLYGGFATLLTQDVTIKRLFQFNIGDITDLICNPNELFTVKEFINTFYIYFVYWKPVKIKNAVHL